MSCANLLESARCTVGIAAILFVIPAMSPAVQIETVTVGDSGNSADFDHATPVRAYGAVDYSFRMGKYEVTNSQYTEFLNAVAQEDANNLFNFSMNDNLRSGIVRDGNYGSYSYSLKPAMGNLPVVFVSFLHAVRFANWLHNGQPVGLQDSTTTEDGAYTIAPNGLSNGEIFRNPGAKWFVPSEDEWYKAAYYDPQKPGGPGYWPYATRTNQLPYSDKPNDSDAPDPANVANYYNNDQAANGYNDGFAVTGSTAFEPFSSQIYSSNVGAYSSASSAYGTFDQSGNVLEWTEGFYPIGPDIRVQRGGAWSIGGFGMASSYQNLEGLNVDHSDFMGFRLAAAIPEPNSTVFVLAGLLFTPLGRRKP